MALVHAHYALTDFARQNDDSADELIIPDDLTGVDDDQLDSLLDQSLDAFEAIHGDGTDVSDDDLDQLQALGDGIDRLREEQTRRATERQERSEKAAEIAARVKPQEQPEAETDAEAEDCEDCDDDDAATNSTDSDTTDEQNADGEDTQPIDTVPDDASELTEAEPVAASGKPKKRQSTRINMASVRRNQARTPRPNQADPQTMADIVTAAPDMPGFANGQGMDWSDIGRGIARRMNGYNPSRFARAAREGKHLRNQYSVAAIRRPVDPELVIESDDPGHVDEIVQRAVNESRLPNGSLTAAGGWCAPSETVYDLCQLESRDGMLSIPEISINRGGIRLATGPDFTQIYTDTGFCYTEAEDIDGDYDGEGGGEKPCFTVPCPTFEDYRLDLCGTCISAGLLQARGYPEVIARTTSGALIAHEHRMNANVINKLVAGSDAVTMPAPQAGATAPILTAIELRVEAAKYPQRMSRTSSFEAVFPYWVRGLIRADLARRLGVDLIDVSDQRINSWFAQRGISAQFVYDWQDLTGDEVAYPDTIDFLLYPAGAWVKGTSDIISIDTIYDSTLLATNDYTALFFEEGWLVAPQCGGSQVVTVSVCPNGSTHQGELIGCDGTGSGSAS